MLDAECAAGFVEQLAVGRFIFRIDRHEVAAEIALGIDHDALIVDAACRHHAFNGDFARGVAGLRATGFCIPDRTADNDNGGKDGKGEEFSAVH